MESELTNTIRYRITCYRDGSNETFIKKRAVKLKKNQTSLYIRRKILNSLYKEGILCRKIEEVD